MSNPEENPTVFPKGEGQTTEYFIEADITQNGKIVKTYGIPAHIRLEEGTVYQDRLKEFAQARLLHQVNKLRAVIKPGLSIELTFYVRNEIAGTWMQLVSYEHPSRQLVNH
jgi:hypothetical protein